jgi:amino-acid N-acetyltransferase
MEIVKAESYRDRVIALLSAGKLPVIDLPQTLDNFFVAIENDKVIGAAGLEIYENYGLLRSLIIEAASRNKGVAAALVDRVEALAAEKGLQGIYLLTENAADYFNGKGFEHVARMDVPEAVKASSQYTDTCPNSAVSMAKMI